MNKIGYITYPELGYTDITSESNLNSKIVGTITDGTEVTITNSENNFYEIVSGQISGWVPQNRVSSMYQKAYIAFPSVGYTDVT
ncbi:SH3 domain-containing protein, partial [uncultured Clostridium sp.]|uniref:SH3 domain-containing protein n=1 Tax=uncultured Clostridium sp. TaxID=59620 RepID=UPI0026030E56